MLRVVIKRSRSPVEPAEQLLEVVTPRTNAALISPAENLFGALTVQTSAPGGGPVALEIVADGDRIRFLIRTGTKPQQRQLRGQVGAAYPQAELRSFEAAALVAGDPLRVSPLEQIAVYSMQLRAGDHLPIRTFQDRDLDADGGAAQTDPVLGVLGALNDLPPGWRAVSQIVLLEPAPPNWARAYQRLALENPTSAERTRGGGAGTSMANVLAICGLGVFGVAGLNSWSAWERGDWVTAAMTIAGLLGVIVVGSAAYLRFGQKELHDPRLVQEKLSREACRAELRTAVIAPSHIDPSAVRARLDRLAAAYRPYALAAGNGFIPRPIRGLVPDLRILAPLPAVRLCLLNSRELAGLWHLPQGADDAPFIERTTARRRLPLAATVGPGPGGEGCQIGVSKHQGHKVPVVLTSGLLQRHLLAIAKTRRGKSSLMLRLVYYLMLAGTTGEGGRGAGHEKHCVVLVDPHSDLATSALALVPPERYSDVVYLDIANRKRPFGVNLLDVGLGWDRDQAVGNALRVFKREFDAF
jgi:hypothetical protein